MCDRHAKTDGGSGRVQFKKGLQESGVQLSEEALQALFRNVDSDCSGYISFDEFTVGVRPEMNDRRRGLVLQAFATMDVNGDGALTVDDVSGRYDCSLHPDVVAGTHTELDVLNNFLSVFDGTLGPKSAIVTPEKFLAYYSNISASIDNDDYFELVLRNVWHMSGGEGQFENTTCRRLLVTHEDGSQTVEEVTNDFEVSRDDLKARPPLLRSACSVTACNGAVNSDQWAQACMQCHALVQATVVRACMQAIKENLREQGIPVTKVALYGYVEEGADAGMLSSTSSPRRGNMPGSPGRLAAGGEASEPALQPEEAAAAYKSRMAQSNVSFA